MLRNAATALGAVAAFLFFCIAIDALLIFMHLVPGN